MATFDLRTHGRAFAAEYPPSGNSDHLPMAWLALAGLGADRARQQAFAAAYIGRLQQLGDLEAAGPSPELEHLADRATHESGVSGTALLQRLAGTAPHFGPGERFDDRAGRLLADNAAAPAAVILDDNLRTMSEAALDVFAATWDFFALHLVTGSHAFRLVQPWVGPRADAVLNLGLALGYLAIGAPACAPAATISLPADRAGLLAACRDDEHDIKIAFSAWDQAAYWDERKYLAVAADYLAGRGGEAPARVPAPAP